MRIILLTAAILVSQLLIAQGKVFSKKIAAIKKQVLCCAVPVSGPRSPKVSGIEIKEDGIVTLSYTLRKPPFSFNLFELYQNNEKSTGIEHYGRSMVLKFYISSDKTVSIHFNSPEAADKTFSLISSLIKHGKQKIPIPPTGKFFIGRNTAINPAQEILYNSIRATDKKDEGDTTIIISSKGEGWLDKDSFPVGEWRFYADAPGGKSYLFKKGNFIVTHPSMYQLSNTDKDELLKNYKISFADLQQQQVKFTPFIKSGSWNYFHDNGVFWKHIRFEDAVLPVITAIVFNESMDNATSLVLQIPKTPDELINKDVVEFDREDKRFKKLSYNAYGELVQKIRYGKNGKILSTEINNPAVKPIFPVNF